MISACYRAAIVIPQGFRFILDSLPLSMDLIVNSSLTTTSQSHYTMTAWDNFHPFINNEAEVSHGYESDEDEDEDELGE